DGLFAGLLCPLPWKLTAEAFYVHNWDRYEDPNSSVSPQVRRKDDVNGVTLRLSRPLTRQLSTYIEYDFNDDNSNIRGYDYTQHLTSAGFIWHF
ncbi:MAG TPA: hypothetical protein VGP99_04920, partial [Tepidisphaeraceae bacterium]|nr:hypothetical protein [Tepidisphaeraceae bacterium]